MRVLAVDPGHTVGYALYDTVTNLCIADQCPWESFAQTLVNLRADVIVYERYFVMRALQSTVAAEVIGMLKLAASFWNASLQQQEPSARKFVSSYFKLSSRTHVPVHASDALKHLLFYFYRSLNHEQRARYVDTLLRLYE